MDVFVFLCSTNSSFLSIFFCIFDVIWKYGYTGIFLQESLFLNPLHCYPSTPTHTQREYLCWSCIETEISWIPSRTPAAFTNAFLQGTVIFSYLYYSMFSWWWWWSSHTSLCLRESAYCVVRRRHFR